MQLVGDLWQELPLSTTVDKRWDLAEMQGCAGEGAAVAHAVAQHVAWAVLRRDNRGVSQHHCVHLLSAQPGKAAALPAPHAAWAPCW